MEDLFITIFYKDWRILFFKSSRAQSISMNLSMAWKVVQLLANALDFETKIFFFFDHVMRFLQKNVHKSWVELL